MIHTRRNADPLDAQSGFETYIANWLRGLDSEIAFWRTLFATGYPDHECLRPEARTGYDFRYPELPPLVCPEGGTLQVLDVGSGPVCTLGTRSAAPWTIELSACDPLAPVYNAILDRHGFETQVRGRFALGEHLDAFYEPGRFHIVHMCNALDHAFDPLAVLASMLRVCRAGGVVYLQHNENEAQFQGYEGLHQWNICAEDGELVFWSRAERFNLTRMLSGAAEVSCTRTPVPGGRVVVAATIRKLAEAELPARTAAADYEAVFKLLCCLLSPECRAVAAGSPAFAAIREAARPRPLHAAWKRSGRGAKRLLLRIAKPGAKP
jgi:SAM-dependent methyltransferase